MAYYYVKNGGTATGDAGRYASQQTGSFASLGTANYYNNIEAAIAATTTPVASDFINVSDLHVFATSAGITYSGVSDNPFFVVCVDDANVDAARTSGNRGREAPTGTSADITHINQYSSGMEFFTADNMTFSNKNTLHDCLLKADGGNDIVLMIAGDNAHVTLVNCEVAMDHTGVFMLIQSGGSIDMFGGSITTTTGGVLSLFKSGFLGAGGTVSLQGVDISGISGTLFAGVGSASSIDDIINIRMDMCRLVSGVAFTNETFKGTDMRLLATRCSDSSAAAEHQYHLHAYGGDVDDDSTIRRADDPAFEESAAIVSYKIVTNSDASLGSPLWFDFPNNRWAALSAGATDTLRLHIASTSPLTDKDIYVTFTYPDGTNKQTPNFVSSGPVTVGGSLDLMAAGTTLTADSGSDWRNGGSALAGHNEYLIDLSTSGDVGADTVPVVRVFITKPSVTIQLGSIFELN